MTEITRAGIGRIAHPQAQPLAANSGQSSTPDKRVRADSVDISAVSPLVDQDRQHQRMAQEVAYRTLKGLNQAQDNLGKIAELWRASAPTPEDLRDPASAILESAGLTYRGVQPLMASQSLQIGPYSLQGFELVGGVIPMQALLPGDEAPAAINQGWSSLQEVKGQAEQQLNQVDESVAESIPASEPTRVEPQAGVHRLPPQSRILELLS